MIVGCVHDCVKRLIRDVSAHDVNLSTGYSDHAILPDTETADRKREPPFKLSSGPVSRVLSRIPAGTPGWSFICDIGYPIPLAANPNVRFRLTPDSLSEADHLSVPIRPCTGWGLPCRPRHRGRGGLLPHPFTLARYGRCPSAGGLLSVALSVGLPRLGVTQHPVLRCSDFPHPPSISQRNATIRPT